MGQIRYLVNRFDLLCSFRKRAIGIAIPANTRARRLSLLAKLLHHLAGAEGLHFAFIPINANRFAGHLRLPKGVRNHSHAGGHWHNLAHAWHIAGVRIIEALHLCAEHRSAGNHCGKHSSIFDVDAKNGFAIYFFWSIEPLCRRADQLERLGIL